MKKWWNPGSKIEFQPYNSVKKCLRFGILHLLLTELEFDTPGVEIGAFLKKKNLSAICIEVFYTYDASDQKHGFLKFWTCNFENGVKWSWGTTLDDSPKKIPAFLLYFCRLWVLSFTFQAYTLGFEIDFDANKVGFSSTEGPHIMRILGLHKNHITHNLHNWDCRQQL